MWFAVAKQTLAIDWMHGKGVDCQLFHRMNWNDAHRCFSLLVEKKKADALLRYGFLVDRIQSIAIKSHELFAMPAFFKKQK